MMKYFLAASQLRSTCLGEQLVSFWSAICKQTLKEVRVGSVKRSCLVQIQPSVLVILAFPFDTLSLHSYHGSKHIALQFSVFFSVCRCPCQSEGNSTCLIGFQELTTDWALDGIPEIEVQTNQIYSQSYPRRNGKLSQTDSICI